MTPTVDAHHHFWEPSLGRNPWLLPEAAIAFLYGDYEAIKRDYLPPDLAADSAGLRVVATVTMETEWDSDDPLGEMDHVESVVHRFGLPDAAVAHAVLRDPGVDHVLEQLAARPLVRGVRNKPGQAASPAEAASHPTLMSDDAWRRGYARLASHGLAFELQTAWWHLDEARELALAHPDVPVTVNHTALPVDRSPEGVAAWAAALGRLAEVDHVWLKISGLGRPGHRWTADANREVVERAAATFGTDRVMFASNFPVDGLTGSYAEVMGGFLTITRGWSPDEQHRAFALNAVRRYELDPAVLDRPSLAERWPSPSS